MTTTFPGEVTLLSYEVSFKTNTDAKFDVTIGEYTKSTEVAANKAVTGYGEDDLSLPTTSFSFSLSNQTKAVYLYSLSLTLLVPSDVYLDLPEAEDNLTPAKPGKGVVPEANYEAVTPEQYYADIDFEAEKTILTQELAELISNMTRISYGEAGPILIYADESISKPGVLYGFYDGDELAAEENGTWNKEHVWACSQMKKDGVDPRPSSGAKNHATDLHNLRATYQNSNGLHGNKFYDNEDSSIAFFPNIEDNGATNHAFVGDFRGDVARILFYMAFRYNFLSLVEDIENADDVSMGRLSVLLEWNEADPVDEFEKQRISPIYEFQGNRNPFIDHPELADKIYA